MTDEGRVKLYAPENYWSLTAKEHEENCNGCGPDGILSVVVPDTVYGLKITAACDIHDYMYVTAEATIAAKNEADRVFLNNMLRLVEARTKSWILKRLRIQRARIYYRAVAELGGPWFWKGKNTPAQMGGAQQETPKAYPGWYERYQNFHDRRRK